MKFKHIALIAALPLVALASQAQAAPAETIENSYICVFKNNSVSRGNVRAESNRAVQAAGGQLRHVYSFAVRGFSANMAAEAVERAKAANPNIAYCEQDQVARAIQLRAFARPGGGATQPAQTTPWGIARVNGGNGGLNGTYSTAWIIDTGIEFTHPDLNVDTARSRSFLDRDTSPVDQNGHGTHVAGTVAALANTIGVIGVAPGAPVVAVRVLDRRGSGSYSGVIGGVDYVAQVGKAGDVANMSLGGGVSQTLDDAVIAAAAGGVRFALAAGNDSGDANLHSPARANGTNVFTVSAFAAGDKFASFSNFGNPPIDFSEPGVGVNSTWLSGGYNTISGTSMATPHLAGLLLTGAVKSGGNVTGDPDGNADVIGVR